MARPRTIDREQLLDVAETIVATGGAASLSFGSLAMAAGLSKASVQSAFVTREALIDAIMDRWLKDEQQRFEQQAGPQPTRRSKIAAHIRTVEAETDEASRRCASLAAALAGSHEQSRSVIEWYFMRSDNLSAQTIAEKRARLAFLAAEGAFFIRNLVRYPIDESLWHDLFLDISSLIESADET